MSGANQRREPRIRARNSGTDTSVGYIEHLSHAGLRCPVMLMTQSTARGRLIATNWELKPIPKRREGRYVYALPGGYSIEGPAI